MTSYEPMFPNGTNVFEEDVYPRPNNTIADPAFLDTHISDMAGVSPSPIIDAVLQVNTYNSTSALPPSTQLYTAGGSQSIAYYKTFGEELLIDLADDKSFNYFTWSLGKLTENKTQTFPVRAKFLYDQSNHSFGDSRHKTVLSSLAMMSTYTPAPINDTHIWNIYISLDDPKDTTLVNSLTREFEALNLTVQHEVSLESGTDKQDV